MVFIFRNASWMSLRVSDIGERSNLQSGWFCTMDWNAQVARMKIASGRENHPTLAMTWGRLLALSLLGAFGRKSASQKQIKEMKGKNHAHIRN